MIFKTIWCRKGKRSRQKKIIVWIHIGVQVVKYNRQLGFTLVLLLLYCCFTSTVNI